MCFQLSHGAGPQCPQGAAQSDTNAFTKGASCGLPHHKYCTPQKTKGTHNTLKKPPAYLLRNERAYASPEGRSKAKCLERNESDEYSNMLKACIKRKKGYQLKNTWTADAFSLNPGECWMYLTGSERQGDFSLLCPPIHLPSAAVTVWADQAEA